ncbi:hypothetical protein F383_37972 [Gossypium arboreum]|uniref:Uncharacterized protein n=1 Tax=Gossypium arboreum TaxID=29729 RepID=A0A0B0MEL3_GOSAR|nr:hypothetical protein F383_37972 [Gossypium arboreum]
MTLSRILAL